MSKRTLRSSFLLAAGSAAAGTFAVRLPARAAEFSWKIGFAPAADHPLSVRIVEACAKIRKDSGGRLDIKVFPNSALGGTDAMASQLRLGALEAMAQSGGSMTILPVASIMQLAYAFPDRPSAFRAWDGDLGALIRNEFPSKGFIALERVYENGWRDFTTSSKAIRSAADLEGMKIRVVPAKLAIDTFRSLGASVTGIEPRELYLALQTHIVDGQESSLALIEANRYYEVQRYLSISRHMWDGFWIIINTQKWQSLPRDLQEMTRAHFNAGALLQRRDIEVQELSLRDLLPRQGLAINEVDVRSFKAKLAASGYYSRWRTEFGPAAWSALEKYVGPLSS
jgi:TRAP-type transport system periplasmic protein